MAVDRARGKIYTKHARLIEIAVREGGLKDPDTNPRLHRALENARSDSVPNVIIERAVKKGAGEGKEGARMEEVIYEAFGPVGTAYIIECLTDNRNRTLSNVKNTLHHHGGRLAEHGAVSWMFEKNGFVETVDIADAAAAKRVSALMEALEEDEDVSEVHTNARYEEGEESVKV